MVGPATSIKRAIEVLGETSLQIALVADAEGRLLGTVTDGDVRRGILRGTSIEAPVETIMNASPTAVPAGTSRERVRALMQAKAIHHVPVVDGGTIVGLEVIDTLLLTPEYDNWVVLMAGGLGSRLRPLTETVPKPMLRIGDKPILETLIESFRGVGFRRFFISVNYLGETIEQYFGDGARLDVEIRYLREEQSLGTAGALALLPDAPTEPLFVMNGDILSRVDLEAMLRFHVEQGVPATLGVRQYDFTVPFGVARIEGHRLAGLDEKPVQKFFINAGIYVLEPDTVARVPAGQRFDMTTLLDGLVADRRLPAVFPIREYWIDVGRFEDLQRATVEYGAIFSG